MYNVAIIGAGPAGIFSALEIVKLRPEWKVVLIEKGKSNKDEAEAKIKAFLKDAEFGVIGNRKSVSCK